MERVLGAGRWREPAGEGALSLLTAHWKKPLVCVVLCTLSVRWELGRESWAQQVT